MPNQANKDIQQSLPVAPSLRHYAVWYGPTWDDIYDCPVENRDENAYTLDEAADYFRFYDRLELEWIVERKVIKLRSEPFNYSPYYVPKGRLLNDMERQSAFESQFHYIVHQSERYQLFGTRFFRIVALYDSDIIFL